LYPLILHKSLTSEKWSSYSKGQQILMIANELNRAKNWIVKEENKEVNFAYERVFELIDLSIEDPKWGIGLKELLRLREIIGMLYLEPKKDIQFNKLCYSSLIAFSHESYNLMNGK